MLTISIIIIGVLTMFRKPLKKFAESIGQEQTDVQKEVKTYLGIKEMPGKMDSNPRIDAMFRGLGYSTMKDDTPWCGAVVGFILKKLGYEIPDQPLRARAYEKTGNKIGLHAATPYHSVVTFWRGSKNASTGHVGFYVKHDDTSVTVCGGNQRDEFNDTLRLPIARLTSVSNPIKLT